MSGDLPQMQRSGMTRYWRFAIVFLAYFLTGKLDQYIFRSFHSAPAIIASPVGIALAFLALWGFEQWMPVALAQFVLAATGSPHLHASVIILSVIVYTAQALIGASILNALEFDGSILRTRDVITLFGVAFITTAIGPGVLTVVGILNHTLKISFLGAWSVPWAGGILSTLIVTPLITSWLTVPYMRIRDTQISESIVAIITVLLATYILFWTPLPTANTFLLVYMFLALFFWIGLRLHPRVMTLALFLATAFGIAGSIIGHPTPVPLNTQLFSDELFIILIAPAFLIMSVIGMERRIAVENFEKKTNDLATANEKLSLQDKSRNEFIAMMAHELRNPLAPIASTLEYLRLNEKDSSNLAAVTMAEQQVHIIRRLLDDLLDVSRITQKKFRIHKEMVTLASVMDSAIMTVKEFYRSKNHHFSFSLPDESIVVEVDPVRMTQAIVNLLFNAAKYTPPGGFIELAAESRGSVLLISIKDNGIGISPEMLPLIFEPFQQANRVAEVGTGLGLGLYIAKQLIEAHGGTITAMSDGVNQGSEFCITLPLQQKNRVPLGIGSALSAKTPGRLFSILIVDDNEAAAQSLQNLLMLRGNEVDAVHDGKSALRAIATFKPQIAILDIGLPDMSGYALAREIKKHDPTIVLIAVTGYGQDQDRLDAKNAGFDHHLTKPIHLADLEKIFDSIDS